MSQESGSTTQESGYTLQEALDYVTSRMAEIQRLLNKAKDNPGYDDEAVKATLLGMSDHDKAEAIARGATLESYAGFVAPTVQNLARELTFLANQLSEIARN